MGWLADLEPTQRHGLLALSALALFGMGVAGEMHLRPKPEMRVEAASSPEGGHRISPDEVMVDVVGAVKAPGVYKLSANSRVIDALRAAGGTLADADTTGLNRAAFLEDGSQIVVGRANPERKAQASPVQSRVNSAPRPSPRPAPLGGRISSERVPPLTVQPLLSSPRAGPPSGSWRGDRPGPKGAPSTPINLNTASQAELETLPGVGPATARKILDYRRAHGGFSSVEELLAVHGIGEKKLAQMRPHVRL
jgi:competence protein ComEA